MQESIGNKIMMFIEPSKKALQFMAYVQCLGYL